MLLKFRWLCHNENQILPVSHVYWNVSGKGKTTELYYISGDRALIQSQSKKCPQKHGGFWPKIRHFDVIIIPIFMVQITDNQNCSEK